MSYSRQPQVLGLLRRAGFLKALQDLAVFRVDLLIADGSEFRQLSLQTL